MNSTARWRLATSGSVTITDDWLARISSVPLRRRALFHNARDIGESVARLRAAVEEARTIAAIREYAWCRAS